jgi:predicted DNA-binding protein
MTKGRTKVVKEKTTIYLPPQMMKKLKNLSDEYGVTYSGMVEKLIKAKRLPSSILPIAVDVETEDHE